jgi:hypothetical protein
MTPISFRAADGLAIDVTLQDETIEPLLGQLRIAAPLLAAKVEDALRSESPQVRLDEHEDELLAAAANVVGKSDRIDDTELERIAAMI